MTMQQVMNSRFYDRNGRIRETPEWVNEKRCGNCQFWQLLPEYEQPPNGWAVRGLCGSPISQNMFSTSQLSYCQEYKQNECI